MKTFYSLLFFAVMIGGFISCQNNPSKGSESTSNDFKHEYVDLELPSGTLWAKYNIGAVAPADYGAYFGYGDTIANPTFASDFKSVDIATAKWGKEWRTPTLDEIKELMNNCTFSWAEMTNTMGEQTKGYLVTSKKNRKSIFFPAAGEWYIRKYKGVNVGGIYWSSTLREDLINSDDQFVSAYTLQFTSDTLYIQSAYRKYGHSVRAVRSYKGN